MRGILKIFFKMPGTRPWLVLACLLLAGFAEAIGLTTLLPTLGILTDDGGAQSSTIARTIVSTVEGLGVQATVENLILLIVIVLSIKSVLTFAALSYAGWAATEAQAVMRAELVENLLAARWSYFTGNRAGAAANAVSNDATRISEVFTVAGRFVAYAVQACVYVAIALVVSWKLALVGLALGAAIAALMDGLVRVTRRAGDRQTMNTRHLVAYVSDAFNNIKPIKTMNRYLVFSAMLRLRLKKLRKAMRKVALSRQVLAQGREVITLVCIGAGAYVATIYWQTPLSEFIVFGAVLAQVVGIVGKLQTSLQTAAEVESAYWRLQELIDGTAAEREPNAGAGQAHLKESCRFEDVTFAHTDRPVVRNVTMEIPAGRITVLQGPSGAGKTTIVDLLTGLYQPDGGRILVDGVSLEKIDLKSWRRILGYVPQDLTLMHDTIYNNITMGDDSLTESDVRDALRTAGALDFVQCLPDGFDTVAGERGLRLSGGERQRIALARALATRPTLLILDEVTSALDPATEARICENIRAMSGAYTIVAITHRPAWAEIADRLYHVSEGVVTTATTTCEERTDLLVMDKR